MHHPLDAIKPTGGCRRLAVFVPKIFEPRVTLVSRQDGGGDYVLYSSRGMPPPLETIEESLNLIQPGPN